MVMKKLLTTLAILGLAAGPVLAQAPAAGTAPAAKPPTATTAAPAPKPAPASATSAPVAKIVNVNTATEKELDGLPGIGKARAKVIMDERAKGAFKDWADFDKRTTGTSVNAGVKKKIKDVVAF